MSYLEALKNEMLELARTRQRVLSGSIPCATVEDRLEYAGVLRDQCDRLYAEYAELVGEEQPYLGPEYSW